jgi:lysophospholipase L1-like esterase
MITRRSFLLASSLVFASSVFAAEPGKGTERPVKIVLVGDSTVQSKSGWGDAFIKLLKPGTECINMGKGGRSSKSYRDEGSWKAVLDQKPTHILLQFGHNDQPGKGPARETDPQTTYPENLARYVDEARAAGAEPILVTSVVRRAFDRADPTHLRKDLEPYAEAVRRVGAEKKVPVVDLHKLSKAQVEKLGPAGAKVLDADRKENPPGTGGDGTHLSAKGAELTAPLVAEELRRLKVDLVQYLQ